MNKKIINVVFILIYSVIPLAIAADQDGIKKASPIVASKNAAQTAKKSLEKIIAAYTAQDLATVELNIDSKMTGYQELIDGIRQDVSRRKNIRIDLRDTTFTANENVAAISTNWEKRFISVAGSATSGTATGHVRILMSRDKDGWKISGITGDNFFVKP